MLLLVLVVLVVVSDEGEEAVDDHLHANNTADDDCALHVVECEEVVDGVAHDPGAHEVGGAVHEGLEDEELQAVRAVEGKAVHPPLDVQEEEGHKVIHVGALVGREHGGVEELGLVKESPIDWVDHKFHSNCYFEDGGHCLVVVGVLRVVRGY